MNAISIDVEEWYHTVLFYKNNPKEEKATNLDNNIREILLLLDKYNTKATFFVVGLVAERHPELIFEIFRNGHEISSHGYSHELVYKLNPKEFFCDVKRSLSILTEITNHKILGYRAPTWSITENMAWAIDMLKSLGLMYDSSIYPLGLNLKGNRNLPYKIRDGLIEFPPSTFYRLGLNLPFAGGTFLRFLNKDFIRKITNELNKKGFPVMVFFHSWEFDNNVPIVGMPLWKKFIQYSNVRTVREKMALLLKEFRFYPVKEMLNKYGE